MNAGGPRAPDAVQKEPSMARQKEMLGEHYHRLAHASAMTPDVSASGLATRPSPAAAATRARPRCLGVAGKVPSGFP